MPAKKKKTSTSNKRVKAATKTVEKGASAFEKAWSKPDRRDGLSFKDTMLVLIIALITMGLGYYIGSVVETSRAADLINRITQQNAVTMKNCAPAGTTVTN